MSGVTQPSWQLHVPSHFNLPRSFLPSLESKCYDSRAITPTRNDVFFDRSFFSTAITEADRKSPQDRIEFTCI